MVIWPLEWFFDGRYEYMDYHYGDYYQDDDPTKQMRVNWENLKCFGWDSCYLASLDYADLPIDAGVYVVVHEYEKPTLYVGQSTNLASRIRSPQHHKISKIVELWGNTSMGYHNQAAPQSEMRVFWKSVKPPYYNNSMEKSLLWCEGISIGLLCPILQGRANDVKGQDWAFGMDYYD